MISYASNTRTKRSLEMFRKYGWRLLLSPRNPSPSPGLRFAIDNGAWGCYLNHQPFDAAGFEKLLESHGAAADFIIVPDRVADPTSLEYSELWMNKLRHFRLPLLALQDGMDEQKVGAFLERYPNAGLFLGGSTEWKLHTMYGWGMVAHAFRRHYHIGRVNTVTRIRLAEEAGADSIDGTSGSLFSITVPRLYTATLQPSLLSPKKMLQ